MGKFDWAGAVRGLLTTAGQGGNAYMMNQKQQLEQAFKQFQMQKMNEDMTMQKEMHDLQSKKLKFLIANQDKLQQDEDQPVENVLPQGYDMSQFRPGTTVKQATQGATLAGLLKKQEDNTEYGELSGTEEAGLYVKKGKNAGTVKRLEGFTKKQPKDAFEVFEDSKGNMQYLAKGSEIPPGWKPYRATPSTNVNVSVGGKGMTEVAKTMGETIVKERADIQQAADALTTLNDAKKLLKSGMVTGLGADYILTFGKGLQRIGINIVKDPIANTQAYAAIMGKQVGTIIKQFGAGTGLSDADREYAEKIVGGKITLTKEAIEKIININDRAYRNVIRNYNKRAKQVMNKPDAEQLPYDLMVEEPSDQSDPLGIR